jgi:SsrA-binding protein
MAERVIAVNRRAHHDYFVEETYEAGIVLRGTEIKSIRAGKVSLQEAHAQVVDGEAILFNAHIAPYEHGGYANHPPRRPRKLLLHKYQIRHLNRKLEAKGYTMVPLRLYLKDGRAKVELGLVRGKRQRDKRAAIAKRDAQREMERALKARGRSSNRLE